MHYEKDVPCPERKEAVFETIKQILLPLNFRIIRENDTGLELKSTGSLWTNDKNPLMGISNFTADIEGQNLKVRAHLGGLKKSIWYLIIFLLFMMIQFVVIFGIAKGFSRKTLFMCLRLFFLPWLIITPMMYFVFKSRAFRAINIMLSNAVGRDI
ncbi:MAG: hypothetical protein ACYS17_02590 [Planctomycetota bacterium]|jgi:hypothetical protein